MIELISSSLFSSSLVNHQHANPLLIVNTILCTHLVDQAEMPCDVILSQKVKSITGGANQAVKTKINLHLVPSFSNQYFVAQMRSGILLDWLFSPDDPTDHLAEF